MTDTAHSRLVSLGIEGLDDILGGGLVPGSLYLVEGSPGAGKTTLAMQFLLEGVKRGEPCALISFSETHKELNASASAHGWSLEGCTIVEAGTPAATGVRPGTRHAMFHPSEVELGATVDTIVAEMQRTRAQRVVLDSLSELRLLAADPFAYRQQVVALKQFFSELGCTVLCTDDQTDPRGDAHLHSIAQGVLSLERRTPNYGVMRRRLQITKMRGRAFRAGYHDFTIVRGGLQVFPRLVAAEHLSEFTGENLSSGLPKLDALLGGGLARGTSTLLLGPAGVGKSTLATHYAIHGAQRGTTAMILLFDESERTFRARARGLDLDVDALVQAGRILLRQVDPAELSPGAFTHMVRRSVEEHATSFIVIDSLNGYLGAMVNEELPVLHLHELLSYLGHLGVTTMLLAAQHGMSGNAELEPIFASYIADAVVLLRYFEEAGRVRQAVSVMKKRTGAHERTIREMRIDRGVQIGEPIKHFQNVLSGNPIYIGARDGTANGPIG